MLYDKQDKKLLSEISGMFTQYPLRLAWTITIHKSQGKTFDRVIIDMGNGAFVPGQLYVALSRCKTLDGIVLTRQVKRKDVMMDDRVVRFMNGEEVISQEKMTVDDRKIKKTGEEYQSIDGIKEIIQQAIVEGKTINLTYQSSEKQSVFVLATGVLG